jgi:ABC-type branched-subunit amino acid transport system substrate-binding protein
MKEAIFAVFRVASVFLLLASTICSAETIKIAVSVGLSGPNAIYGEGQLNAFKAAADIVNARGAVCLGVRRWRLSPWTTRAPRRKRLSS